MSAVLEGRGLVAVRDGRRVVDEVSVGVRPGERVAVMGPSGSGKTTLLALLGGLEPPETGTVLLGGTPLVSLDPVVLRHRIGLVLQGYGLLSLLTAEENVEIGLRAADQPDEGVRDRVQSALERVGLAPRAHHLVEELSGGEAQRVAVARVLATDPAVVLADEPTAALDAATRGVVLDALLGLADHGIALVLATHDPHVASRCDRVLRLHSGRIEEEWT